MTFVPVILWDKVPLFVLTLVLIVSAVLIAAYLLTTWNDRS
jgi:hypothetical protein